MIEGFDPAIWVLLNRMHIIIIVVPAWKNGIRHQMTLYYVVIAAGEQAHILRLSVHPAKSIIV